MKTFFIFYLTTLALFTTIKPTIESPDNCPIETPTNNTNTSGSAVKPKIWAQQDTLYLNDTLTLHFSLPNAPFLGVVDPDGHFFYLVYPADPDMATLMPLVDSKDFIGVSILIINTQTLKADPYTVDVFENQPVFVRPGKYTFITGENLHIDDPALLGNVCVEYVNNCRSATIIEPQLPPSNNPHLTHSITLLK